MRLLWVPIEVALVSFGGWTLAYHLCLIFDLPAGRIWILFLLIAVPAGFYFCRHQWQKPVLGKGQFRLLGWALALATLAGTVTLFNSRPDADDASFFHRALVQLPHMDQPFITNHTHHDVSDLPPLSVLHVMTSYEVLMAFAGNAICGDALWFYQNIGAFIAAFLFCLVMTLLFRHLGLRPAQSLWGVGTVLGFLAIDGGLHRSFGNVSLVRFWQGKCIVWLLLVALVLLMSILFLRHPNARRFALLFFAGVSAVGLSGSGIVLVPVLVFCVSVSFLIAWGSSWHRIGTVLALNLAVVYCTGAGALYSAGFFPRADMTAWNSWELVWWKNLYLVVPGHMGLIRNAVFLTVIPFLTLHGRKKRFLVLLTFVMVIVFANPITGPVILQIVSPATYWRLAYLFPLLVGVGLTVGCFVRTGPLSRRILNKSGALLAIAATALAFSTSVFPGTEFKRLRGYKLPVDEAAFSMIARVHLNTGDTVLAPEKLAWVLILVKPSIRLVAGRKAETRHVFRSAGREGEGESRILAQQLVETGILTAQRERALYTVFEEGLDAIAVTPGAYPVVTAILGEMGVEWSVCADSNGYILVILGP